MRRAGRRPARGVRCPHQFALPAPSRRGTGSAFPEANGRRRRPVHADQRPGAQPRGLGRGLRRHPAPVRLAGRPYRRAAFRGGGVHPCRGPRPGRAGGTARRPRDLALAVALPAPVGPLMTLAATLTPEEAAGRGWEAVVVGAGPAGSLAARELARRGTSVLLVDRAAFPRGKVCGCCLNQWSLTTLRGVGLAELPGRCGAVRLRAVRLAARRGRALLRLPEVAALSRERFDAALVEAAVQAGAAFLPLTRAALGGLTEEGRRVVLRQGEQTWETSARVVLA